MKPKLSNDAGLHETTIDMFDKDRKLVGNIDVKILYRVLSYGRDAYISGPAENCYPAEGAEIDVINVDMYDAPYAGRDTRPVPAWDWLIDLAIEYCEENATLLAGEVRLRGIDEREASDDAKYDYERENR